jgi:hypothetical protein
MKIELNVPDKRMGQVSREIGINIISTEAARIIRNVLNAVSKISCLKRLEITAIKTAATTGRVLQLANLSSINMLPSAVSIVGR